MKTKNFLSFILFAFSINQTVLADNNPVKLIQWTSTPCDNTYDPYLLKNRITYKETIDASTFITVNFSANCCGTFKPEVQFFENKLTLLTNYYGAKCSCNCCFSIEFEISGLAGKQYDVYFNDEKVVLSGDYYETVEPSFKLYNGQKINRTTKYGFKEGIWMTFYEDGQLKSISQYPDTVEYYDARELWVKRYYPSGSVSYYQRNDTTQSWFEDGEIKSEWIKYKVGDTIFDKSFRKFDNRILAKKEFEKFYPAVFKSDLNPEYESEGHRNETIYEEEYFENGKLKYLYGIDTSYAWYENGQLKYKSYEDGKIEYDEDGTITEKSFDWYERAPDDWDDLGNFLHVYFYKNGTIKEIEFARDEMGDHDRSMGRCWYRWKWDTTGKPTAQPKKWKGTYPWKRYPEIKVPPLK
jgi:hypothetical protein